MALEGGLVREGGTGYSALIFFITFVFLGLKVMYIMVCLVFLLQAVILHAVKCPGAQIAAHKMELTDAPSL